MGREERKGDRREYTAGERMEGTGEGKQREGGKEGEGEEEKERKRGEGGDGRSNSQALTSLLKVNKYNHIHVFIVKANMCKNCGEKNAKRPPIHHVHAHTVSYCLHVIGNLNLFHIQSLKSDILTPQSA